MPMVTLAHFNVNAMQKVVAISVSVVILANNALRAHHASAHGGVSTNGLLNICLNVF